MSIISVQSCVSHGHVGNSAAVFVLQRMGLEVDALHTVLYSSHLGYAGCQGRALPPEHLAELADGLEAIGRLAITRAMLTGYLGSAAHGAIALELLERARQARAPAPVVLVCDPVMGDHGRLYVPEALVEFHARRTLPTADLLTPNQFELGVLSQAPVGTLAEALEACRGLLARMRPGAWVIARGLVFAPEPEELSVLAVGPPGAWRVRAPYLPRRFAGAGDLFSAALCGAHLQGLEVFEAAFRAACVTAGVLEQTWQMGRQELALIAAQDQLAATSHPGVTMAPVA